MPTDCEYIFLKDVNVLLKDYDQRSIPLSIAVSIQPSKSTGCGKEFCVRLTNSSDPFFLQNLSLTEEEFQRLKTQQGLLIDFGAFPQNFIDLLEHCIKEQDNTVPRFLLHFTSKGHSGGVLDVVETNPFKHLVHLSLKFLHGNDEEIKTYLAACLNTVKEEKKILQQQFNVTEKDLSTRLSTAEQLLSERCKELELQRTEWQNKFHEAQSGYRVEVTNEKQIQAKLQKSYEERLQTERLTFEERYSKSVRELENRLRELQTTNKDLSDQKYKYESLLREMKSRVASLEEERLVSSKDVQQLRRQNTNLDSDRHERDKTLNHLRTRVAVLEQELKDKQQVIQRTNELLETSNVQKNGMNLELENRHNNVKQLENTVRSLSAEVVKGNEIIQKLQTEIKSLKSRVKMINIVMAKQERLIEEKDASLSKSLEEGVEFQNRIKELENKVKQLQKDFDETTQKFDESQETIKNNDNVINWLNKQLNEQTIDKLSSTYNTTAVITNTNRIPYKGRPMTSVNTNLQHMNQSTNIHRLAGYLPSHSAVPSRLTQQQPTNHPILKKPQFHTDGISPIVPQQNRYPIRVKQMSTPVVCEATEEELLDPKYLMEKTIVSDKKTDVSVQDENTDPNTFVGQQTKANSRSVKPVVISSSYFPSSN